MGIRSWPDGERLRQTYLKRGIVYVNRFDDSVAALFQLGKTIRFFILAHRPNEQTDSLKNGVENDLPPLEKKYSRLLPSGSIFNFDGQLLQIAVIFGVSYSRCPVRESYPDPIFNDAVLFGQLLRSVTVRFAGLR